MTEIRSGASERLLRPVKDEDDEEFTASGHSKKELRAARHKAFARAIYSEFMGTFIFLTSIFGAIANTYNAQWDPTLSVITVTLSAGLTLIATIMTFSSLSGSQLNPAITVALWITGKLSNRKCFAFIVAQILASIAVVACIHGSFPDVHPGMLRAMSVEPPANASLGNIFFSEFLTTFILTYVAFAMAFEEAESNKAATMSLATLEETDGLLMYSSTPQSKAGFAPFAIGFILVGLAFYGGGSGVCMNPARLIGPAVFSGVWDKWYMYFLGEFLGAAAAAFLIDRGPQSAQRENNKNENVSLLPSDIRESLSRLSVKVQKGATDTANAIRNVATGGDL